MVGRNSGAELVCQVFGMKVLMVGECRPGAYLYSQGSCALMLGTALSCWSLFGTGHNGVPAWPCGITITHALSWKLLEGEA